jgi:hypothetical protein
MGLRHCGIKGRDLSEPPKLEGNLNMSSITSHFHFAVGRPLANGGYSTSLRRFAGRLANAWRHHRDELELESLPFDLRKDIGYPSADEDAELTGNTRTRH